MKKILTLKEYFISRFGVPLQRLAVDPGFPCPHRDKYGKGGCAFCAADGARARYLEPGMDPVSQIQRGVKYLQTRYGAKPPYALYFQAFTPTNAPVAEIRRVYGEFIAAAPELACIIVATRPDCLPDDVVDYLAQLNQRYEVWVELGVQTACDRTLAKINRGHNFAAVQDAVKRLAAKGIRCAAHVILGLPCETETDFLHTADELAVLPFSGVKVHNLLVMRGTALETMYRNGEVTPLNEYEYAEHLGAFLGRLPEGWVVMRLCADAGESEILAPHWQLDKTAFSDMFLRMYSEPPEKRSLFPVVQTGDGSYTCYHPVYHQHFHSMAGAWEESEKKYLLPSRMKEAFAAGKTVRLLDVGFGMGCNLCSAALTVQGTCGRLEAVTLESDPSVFAIAMRLPGHKAPEIVKTLAETGHYQTEQIHIELKTGDARKLVSALDGMLFDCIFLDGFSPDTNPELWTSDFLKELKKHLSPAGVLITYSSAYPFRGALLENGFCVRESEPYGRKRGGTVAALTAFDTGSPLPEKELNIILRSTAGTPYRDPDLASSREDILQRHHEEIMARRKTGIPKWYRGDNKK